MHLNKNKYIYIHNIQYAYTVYIGITAGPDAYDQCLNLSAKTISYDNITVMNYNLTVYTTLTFGLDILQTIYEPGCTDVAVLFVVKEPRTSKCS